MYNTNRCMITNQRYKKISISAQVSAKESLKDLIIPCVVGSVWVGPWGSAGSVGRGTVGSGVVPVNNNFGLKKQNITIPTEAPTN